MPVPYLTETQAAEIASLLQERLWVLNDLQLLLKHVHWNVTGPNFIAVHEMIDPQIDEVRLMVDAIAERIAMLGGTPQGTAETFGRSVGGPLSYPLGRASVAEHLAAVSKVYDEVVRHHYQAAVSVGEVDEVTNGLLLAHVEQLDLFHWFVKAHLG
ncbi:MAG: DNA starvation/stationary phase protection protein [Promicromonosporaceae bacterium]|nr:DNA starvation/stationary phase protection protein [Promicromonosporaceae bacterium]